MLPSAFVVFWPVAGIPLLLVPLAAVPVRPDPFVVNGRPEVPALSVTETPPLLAPSPGPRFSPSDIFAPFAPDFPPAPLVAPAGPPPPDLPSAVSDPSSGFTFPSRVSSCP